MKTRPLLPGNGFLQWVPSVASNIVRQKVRAVAFGTLKPKEKNVHNKNISQENIIGIYRYWCHYRTHVIAAQCTSMFHWKHLIFYICILFHLCLSERGVGQECIRDRFQALKWQINEFINQILKSPPGWIAYRCGCCRQRPAWGPRRPLHCAGNGDCN